MVTGALDRRPDLPAIYWTDQAENADWAPFDDADLAADLAIWQAECEAARLRAAAHGLDDAGVGMRGGQLVECSVRWTYHHMIEEYARHNGTPT